MTPENPTVAEQAAVQLSRQTGTVRDILKGEELTINYKEYDADWPRKLGSV